MELVNGSVLVGNTAENRAVWEGYVRAAKKMMLRTLNADPEEAAGSAFTE